MPVFHFTLHAYNSWNADHPEGYHQHDEHGVHPPNPALGRWRSEHAKFPPMEFVQPLHQVLIDAAHDVCGRRRWRPHGIMVIPTHIHLAISWQGARESKDVQTILKRILGLALSRHLNMYGRTWFSEGGLPERVKNKKHLMYLLDEYFPGHRGTYWWETVT